MKSIASHIDDQNDVEDRLSSLPVDILIEVISFLPLKSAIATGALSKTWRGLWKETHCIDLSINHILERARSSSSRFGGFAWVNQLLLQLKSPVLRRFDIKLPYYYEHSGECLNSYLHSWTRSVCDRGVEEICIESSLGIQRWNRGDYVVPTIPQCLLQTTSLTTLELVSNGFLFYYLPPMFGTTTNLSNLRRLNISVLVTNHASINDLANLISSCSSLEHLSLGYGICLSSDATTDSASRSQILKLSSHRLKKLRLDSIHHNRGNEIAQVAINAPALEQFHMEGSCLLKVSFMKTPACLIDADIKVSIVSRRACTALMNAISGVRSLYLLFLSPNRSSSSRFNKLVTFSNLTHLAWSLETTELNDLPLLLERCPCLIHLCLWVSATNSSSTPPYRWPRQDYYRLTNVKSIEIKLFRLELDDSFLDFVKDMLYNAHVLEQLIIIAARYSTKFRLERIEDDWKCKESIFQDKLNKCATMIAPSCRIAFIS